MYIQNPDAAQAIRDQAGLTLAEGFPENLLPNVQPVMDMTPRFHRNVTSLGTTFKTSTGSSTIFTSSAIKRTFVTGLTFSFVKDATCDVAIGQVAITCSVGGASKTIASLAILTTTAQQDSIAVSFERPIEIDKSSIVAVASNTYTLGLMSRTATITGYEI